MAVEATAAARLDALDMLIIPSPVLAADGCSFPDVDPATGLYVGGNLRLLAAAEFSRHYKPAMIVVVGGIDPQRGTLMTDAMSRFILGKNPDATVRAINSLPCTRHNVVAIFNQLPLHGKRVAVLTNNYHLTRFLAFWSQLRNEYGLAIADALPVVAETICDATGAQKHLTAIEARIAAEQRGLADLRAGKYTDRCLAQLESFAEVTRNPIQYLTPDEQMALH